MNGDLNDKDTLEQHIREVQVGTCTNLMAGLARGFEVNLKFVFHFRGTPHSIVCVQQQMHACPLETVGRVAFWRATD